MKPVAVLSLLAVLAAGCAQSQTADTPIAPEAPTSIATTEVPASDSSVPTTLAATTTTAAVETTTTVPLTTTTAVSTTSTLVTTAPAEPPDIVLRHDGLGIVGFLESADTVMAGLTDVLGPPDRTEVQISPDTDLSVQWDDPFLYLQFTYWAHFEADPQPAEPVPEGPIFHYYLTRSDAWATQEGLRVNATVAELVETYPNVRFVAGCYDIEREFVLDPTEGIFPMWGLLSGEPEDETSRIEYIGAGYDRSPC